MSVLCSRPIRRALNLPAVTASSAPSERVFFQLLDSPLAEHVDMLVTMHRLVRHPARKRSGFYVIPRNPHGVIISYVDARKTHQYNSMSIDTLAVSDNKILYE